MQKDGVEIKRGLRLSKNQNVKTLLIKSGIYILLIAMIIGFAFMNSNFLTFNNLINIIQQVAPIGIAVVGISLVLFIGGIDISVGSVMYLSVVSSVVLLNDYKIITEEMIAAGWGYIPLFGIPIVVGLLVGLFNGLFITKFSLQPFIVTLASFSIFRGLGYVVTNCDLQSTRSMSYFANSRLLGIPLVFILFVLIVLGFHFIVTKFAFGRKLMAIGNNPDAARVAGINIDKYKIISYVLCGGIAAFSGIIAAGQISMVELNFAEGNEFDAITAAVLGGVSLYGGKGSIFPGAFIGIFLITIVLNGLAMVNASVYVYSIVRAVIIFLGVMLDSLSFKGERR